MSYNEVDIDVLIRNCDQFSVPYTKEEGKLLKKIQKLPTVNVVRCKSQDMVDIGMRTGECHFNVIRLRNTDISIHKNSKHVFGWLFENNMYHLHSVLYYEGEYRDITPLPFCHNHTYDFHVDKFVSIGFKRNKILRNGKALNPHFARVNARETIELVTDCKRRLLTGDDPFDVMGIDKDYYYKTTKIKNGEYNA